MDKTKQHPRTKADKEQYFNPYDVVVGAFIPNNIMRRKDLSSAAKLCWARIAGYTGMVDSKCKTMDELAAAIGLSLKDTVEGVKELKTKGLVR